MPPTPHALGQRDRPLSETGVMPLRTEQTTARPQTDRVQARKDTGKARKPAKLSRLHKPEGLSLEAWQIELRRQFGREQKFVLENLGDEPVFSEFAVTNPASGNTYRVQIRGRLPGDNACTCPD